MLSLTSSKLGQICCLGTLYDRPTILQHSLFVDAVEPWDVTFPMYRAAGDRNKTATVYKSEKRKELEEEGYRILGNSGDQWSDLLGSSISARSFKLPNPMYYIPWQKLKTGRVKGAVFIGCTFYQAQLEHSADWWLKMEIISQWNLNCTNTSLTSCSIHTLPVSSTTMVTCEE